MSYGQLEADVRQQIEWLEVQGVQPGAPVILRGDYSPLAVSMLLALIERCCIVIPLTPEAFDSLRDFQSEVSPAWIVDVSGDAPKIERLQPNNIPELYKIVMERRVPGLVLFTSGSSGKPKAVVHDFSKLLEKFHVVRPAMITLNFLLFDHWGGLNTLLHCLSNLCLIVVPERRTPEHVCELIAAYGIELLPTTPSFLNMLLISRAYSGHDLSSLKLITYGAEPMPETTLRNLRKVFPGIELRQTYGMIELGVLRAKSRSPDSLWLKLGGAGYNVRVVDNILQIRADAAMLGYINAESPFTDDGFLITGDLVETDGEWIRILGRQSDIINVGGQKVYPAEVETVILDCPEVADAVVYGEPNVILGEIVCVNVILREGSDEALARRSIRQLCGVRLQAYMVPVKIKFVTEIAQSHRLKRVRSKL
ncbi:putative acyl--CoA ligase YhfT [Betaproteobacteria bacterium MOLA814]|nr:putative acyl--CoA ligase YhfT [Betaproteobacteria bacterium MOLA814]